VNAFFINHQSIKLSYTVDIQSISCNDICSVPRKLA